MVFNPNIPPPNQDLSDSQPILLTNNQSIDASFGIDHYAFSNATTNNGFHNTVTTPLVVGSAHPVTAAAIPKFYAMQDSNNLGVIQYSRGPSNSVPTPLTSLHSGSGALTLAPNGTTNVFDCTGLTLGFFELSAQGTTTQPAQPVMFSYIFWNGTSLASVGSSSAGSNNTFGPNFSGNIIQIKWTSLGGFTLSNLFWTLKLLRVA